MDTFFEEEDKLNQGGVTLDFKRILARSIRFWYVILLSILACLTIAFYQTRYSQKVYPVAASIMIRETQETGGAELLYKNSLIDPYRNYLNEPYIITSYPLIEQVVKDLNVNLTFFREGTFLTTDAYSYIPVEASWCGGNEIKPTQFLFTLLGENKFSLSRYPEDFDEEKSTFNLNDTISIEDVKLCITKRKGRSITPYVETPFILSIQASNQVTETYIRRLSVDWAEEGAGIINLGLTGTNPEKEIDFLNALINAYRQLDLEKKNEAAERTIDFIQDQLIGIKDSLRTIEFQLERFGSNGRIKDMSAEAQRLLSQLEVLQAQNAELLIKKSYYKYLDDYLKGTDTFDQVILPTSVGLNDPLITTLLTKMMDKQLELRAFSEFRKEKNPLIAGKVDQLLEIRKEINESLGTLRTTDKIKENFLLKQISDIEKQMSTLPESERQLVSIQRNYSLMENLYVFLMQKLSEAGISKASNTSDIIPVNPPRARGVISPKPLQNYSIAGVIGLLIPIVIFTLFEMVNNKVQSKEDITKMTNIPFVGGVGHDTSGSNLSVISHPKSGLSESFRSLRSNLNFFTGNKPKRVFMVSSSISGEGKTFTTINLATVFAMSNKKTLIVGADMRRPKIFQDFKGSNDTGLSTYLSSISTFEEVIQPTDIDNLFFVSGGPVPPNPSELLLTDKFEIFVKKALENFDFVLIDTPPLALVTDAFVISKFADHTVFVMRQNYSPKDFVKSINEYYQSGKINNISILLNDIYKSGLGYGYGQGYAYKFGYGYGYGYGRRTKNDGYYSD